MLPMIRITNLCNPRRLGRSKNYLSVKEVVIGALQLTRFLDHITLQQMLGTHLPEWKFNVYKTSRKLRTQGHIVDLIAKLEQEEAEQKKERRARITDTTCKWCSCLSKPHQEKIFSLGEGGFHEVTALSPGSNEANRSEFPPMFLSGFLRFFFRNVSAFGSSLVPRVRFAFCFLN